jgi:hypothetical protein
MRHVFTKKLPFLAIAAFAVSLPLISSASAQVCDSGLTNHCDLKADGGGGGSGPMGSIINQNMGTLMPNSGFNGSTSHNGYSTANQSSSQSGGTSVKDVAERNNVNVGKTNEPNTPIFQDDGSPIGAALNQGISAAEDKYLLTKHDNNLGGSIVIPGIDGQPDGSISGINYVHNPDGSVDFDRLYFHSAPGGRASDNPRGPFVIDETHVHINPNRTTVTRDMSRAPRAPVAGPGSVTTIDRKTGKVTTVATHITGVASNTGSANRQKIKSDPALLAEARAKAKAAAAAPSAPHTPRAVTSSSTAQASTVTASKKPPALSSVSAASLVHISGATALRAQ